MLKALKNLLFPLLIVALAVFIAFKNFTSGTWLLGWDNLAPELNFKLNIARSLSAVWQEYQGLGLLGGMAHAADLPRQLILAGLSVAIPVSHLRYLWTFLMLVAGPLGVYFLVYVLITRRGLDVKTTSLRVSLSALTSAIFYIFNLATVQTFFTPFETFISFYGFLPWFLFLAVKYLREGKKKYLLIFALVSLFGASSFYVQTLFIVYVIFLIVLSLEAIFRYKKAGFLRVLGIAAVTVFINAFWLFPVSYFTLTGSDLVGSSHINSIATPETKLMNLARGDFKSVAALKGYWFDYYDWNGIGDYKLLYQDWIDHTSNTLTENVSMVLFWVSLTGFILYLTKTKNAFGQSTIFLFGIAFFMLSGVNLEKWPILDEAFRNVFTKWSNAAALLYSLGLGLFVYSVSGIIKNRLKYVPAVVFSGAIVAGSIFTTYPIIQGKLIANSMKTSLPSYYVDTINYFKGIDSTKRIAAFPFTDFWGWQFNDWGYRGSGFIWYGIPQPVLSRTFDVWSPLNENFYKEANYALSSGSVADFERVLAKYQISYLLYDGSIYEPGNPNSAVNLEKERQFLESSSLISTEKTFGKITIYKVGTPEINNFVSAPKNDDSQPLYKVGERGNLVVSETFSINQGYAEAKNCNLRQKGVVIKEKRDGGNYYKAEGDGVSCDYFYYPTLDLSKAYGMRIVGGNISGRSLRFYLYNVKGEKITMDELLPSGDFDKTYTILPTGEAEDQNYGYTLNVETRSFGKVKSENEITKIEFYELPVEKTEPLSLQNNLQILGVKKYGTWGYIVDISGSGLVSLDQGYEKEWVGIKIPNSKLQITNYKFLEHTKVNSWANGWIVPSTINNHNQNSIIYIFFWPQALEWGGMAVGIAAFLIIILKRKIK